MKKNILIVDDEENIRLALRYALMTDQVEVSEADGGANALELTGKSSFDLILLDLRMPQMDGLTFLSLLRARNNRIPVILISAYTTTDIALDAIKHGVIDFLAKPVTPPQIRDVVSEVLQRHCDSVSDEDSSRLNPFQLKMSQAKRMINHLDFENAKTSLVDAVKNENRQEANLLIAMLYEIEGDFVKAEEYYGSATTRRA